jgi:hypothetical protein
MTDNGIEIPDPYPYLYPSVGYMGYKWICHSYKDAKWKTFFTQYTIQGEGLSTVIPNELIPMCQNDQFLQTSQYQILFYIIRRMMSVPIMLEQIPLINLTWPENTFDLSDTYTTMDKYLLGQWLERGKHFRDIFMLHTQTQDVSYENVRLGCQMMVPVHFMYFISSRNDVIRVSVSKAYQESQKVFIHPLTPSYIISEDEIYVYGQINSLGILEPRRDCLDTLIRDIFLNRFAN